MKIVYAYIICDETTKDKREQLNKLMEYNKNIKEHNIFIDKSNIGEEFNKLTTALEILTTNFNDLGINYEIELVLQDMVTLKIIKNFKFLRENKISLRILSIKDTLNENNYYTDILIDILTELEPDKNILEDRAVKTKRQRKVIDWDYKKLEERFIEHNVHGLTVKRIAQEFGVSETTIHKKFSEIKEKNTLEYKDLEKDIDEKIDELNEIEKENTSSEILHLREYNKDGVCLCKAMLIKKDNKFIVLKGSLIKKIDDKSEDNFKEKIEALRIKNKANLRELMSGEIMILNDIKFDTLGKATMFVMGKSDVRISEWKTEKETEEFIKKLVDKQRNRKLKNKELESLVQFT